MKGNERNRRIRRIIRNTLKCFFRTDNMIKSRSKPRIE